MYLEIGKQRDGWFENRLRGTEPSLFSILPSGPTTGVCLPHWQAVVFVGQDIPLSNRQMLKHFYSFSFSTFMLFPPPVSQQHDHIFSDGVLEYLIGSWLCWEAVRILA